jgi:hypothetical protein
MVVVNSGLIVITYPAIVIPHQSSLWALYLFLLEQISSVLFLYFRKKDK